MSTRSYTARLHQRAAAPRRTGPSRAGLVSRYQLALIALLTLVAEVGHLAAALVEWPAGPARGIAHVLAAAALGALAAAVYFGPSGRVLIGGIALCLALPIAWLATTIAGLSPYADFPLAAAIVLAGAELALATVLAIRFDAVRTG